MVKKLRVDDGDIAYITLPDYPERVKGQVVFKTVVLDDLVNYQGPRIHLDFNEEGIWIGIEILA